ncbi:MAG: alpha-mannosidase, partial [Burkholderiales bacterium]|nr:alpha-mannosidase [Opitutaceae bacterium]
MKTPLLALLGTFAAAHPVVAQTTPTVSAPADKNLYVVGYAHLDTQWRWTYPKAIRDYIPNTMRRNFPLFEKYPDYVFNFSGSRRYEFMKEYYPEDYAKVKDYVAKGRWFPAGSSVDEGDGIVPSLESYQRHFLYGNRFFDREFGVHSDEFMLPDCFGFPAALPSILHHGGVKGFSTQKLSWGSAAGIPFSVGVWTGPDGSEVIAALNPLNYTGKVTQDLSQSQKWIDRINVTGEKSGAYVDYHYYGVGDRGGAPDEGSVQWIEKSIAGKGPLKVVSTRADQMFNDITPAQHAKLPRYQGELLLTEHSAGSVSSQAYMKRWNRKNELLASAAESTATAASWLGAFSYPHDNFYRAWDLVIGSQMHDILPGTSMPPAYEYSWNDEVIALNQFAAITERASAAVLSALDTRAKGVPVAVYNPLSIPREDPVEVLLPFTGEAPRAVTAFNPEGKPVPTQILGREGDALRVLFLAQAPSVGFAIYDLRAGVDASPQTGLAVTEKSLENARYRVTLDGNGDVASIFDKAAQRELLSAPARLGLHTEIPKQYPAWNMDWADRQKPARAFVGGPATVRIVENGAVRVTLEVTRTTEGSTFVERIRLAAGTAGDRVEYHTRINWRSFAASLKTDYRFTVANPQATYDAQVGVVVRDNNHAKRYESPLHQWMDLT